MRYVSEFRDGSLARKLARAIAQASDRTRNYHLMEFCGGHTHAIFRYGVQDLVPENVKYVHGPGCPVCVLPVRRLDDAVELALNHDVILCTYGDMMRVPGTKQKSLIKAKAEGADIRMVYSTQDALRIARDNPHREVVFFAIGFETTTPPTAIAILQAKAEGLKNFTVFCNHVLTPPAIAHIVNAPAEEGEDPVRIDGFLGPSHVSSVTGSKPYEPVARIYKKPVVIAGFEPLDVMQSTLMLIRQINEGRHDVENQYTRVVTRDGNRKAQRLVEQVLELRREFEWRGLGTVPQSALKIRKDFSDFDAEQRFPVSPKTSREVKSCECPAILRGAKRPTECKLFGNICTPDNPMGACMVSSEGACAAYWTYGRKRGAAAAIKEAAV
ncbi:MAG: hydrogenase formation protein HypD [Roseibium album]|uniref:hydrogenase formation protein HypD n=1 Tax=Roseibium album TaxID=311410 RepID=UPI0032EC0EAA